jgi:hypothetical protein
MHADCQAMKLSLWPLADTWAQRRLLVGMVASQGDPGITSLVDFLTQPSHNAKARCHNQ